MQRRRFAKLAFYSSLPHGGLHSVLLCLNLPAQMLAEPGLLQGCVHAV